MIPGIKKSIAWSSMLFFFLVQTSFFWMRGPFWFPVLMVFVMPLGFFGSFIEYMDSGTTKKLVYRQHTRQPSYWPPLLG